MGLGKSDDSPEFCEDFSCKLVKRPVINFDVTMDQLGPRIMIFAF